MSEQGSSGKSCVLTRTGEGSCEEKKSRFLSLAAPVFTEAEALSVLADVRRKHYAARHHCFAYILGAKGNIKKASDDGEPSGTAGKPILEALEAAGIREAVLVVTRYFGGTLLGTGGLARAYREAARDAIQNGAPSRVFAGLETAFSFPYTEQRKLERLFRENGWHILASTYAEQVSGRLLIPLADKERAPALIREKTGGRVSLLPGTPCRYVLCEGKAALLPENQPPERTGEYAG